MAKIHVLEKQIAELIAAGEVVERPASIVKELVENAVDAGATAVTVEIQNGGISYIRVTDNGSGIEREDIANAFLRHATSKLKSSEDLEHILTMGFRGEALASIAAMCKVELLTRTEGEVAGTRFVIHGGEQQTLEDAGCPVGTTILVRDVFYNTPARMKFLKKDVSEGNSIAAVVEKIALAYPDVSFQLIRDKAEKLHTPGDGKLLSAVRCALGREFAQSSIPVDYALENGLHLQGLICKPQTARGSRTLQNFFINRRFIRSKACMAALEEAYRGSLMVGRFPSCVLNLTIPAETVDVNVHPAKIEVRFADEKSIFHLVHYGCKTALGAADLAPRISLSDHRPSVAVEQPLPEQQRISAAAYRKIVGEPVGKAQAQSLEQPAFTGTGGTFHVRTGDRIEMPGYLPPVRKKTSLLDIETDDSSTDAPEWLQEQLHQDFFSVKSSLALQDDNAESFQKIWQSVDFSASQEQVSQECNTEMKPAENLESEKAVDTYAGACLVGELFDTYLVLQNGEDVLLVDKHAAHERLLFNRMLRGGLEEDRQLLLNPVSVRLSAEEYSAVLEHLPELSAAGLTVEDFGDHYVVVREVAPILAGADLPVIVTELAGRLAHENSHLLPKQIIELYHTAACRAAIKAHDKTATPSLEQLIEMLREDDDARHCPHGRPVMVRLGKQEIEKRFGRLG